MTTILFLSCVTAFIMLIWLKTDAVVEWVKIFGFKKMYDEFRNAKIDAAPNLLTYPQYLKGIHSCFMTKMLSCPFCLCTWLVALQCFGLAVLFSSILIASYFPIVYFLSLFIYSITVKLFDMHP